MLILFKLNQNHFELYLRTSFLYGEPFQITDLVAKSMYDLPFRSDVPSPDLIRSRYITDWTSEMGSKDGCLGFYTHLYALTTKTYEGLHTIYCVG